MLAEAPAVMFSCCQGLYLCSRVSSGRLSIMFSKQKYCEQFDALPAIDFLTFSPVSRHRQRVRASRACMTGDALFALRLASMSRKACICT